MLLSIIILNYQKPHLTISCIKSLADQFEKEFSSNIMELIIVDNASGDDSIRLINNFIKSENISNVRLIENKSNEGFSKGCNLGAKKSQGKYFLFLNNDTTVQDRGIYKMIQYLEEENEAAILGGQLIEASGKNQPSVGGFYTVIRTFLLLIGMQSFGLMDQSPKNISEVDWVKGALLMIRKNVFDALSGFDENIFMYTEDMELCYRAKKLGYKTFFYPAARVTHHDQGSSNRSFAVVQIYKGILYFFKKHRSNLDYNLVKIMLYIKAYLGIAVGLATGNEYLTTTFREAIQF